MAEFLIAFVELLEAEGRALQRSALALGRSLAFLGCAVLLLMLGVGCLLTGSYLIAARVIGAAEALLLTGTLAAGAASIFLWLSNRERRP
ncbi:MAG: hypothetical protein MUF20_10205 [Methylotetracoccus sp.]|nr:hypothetical protein [Methylotetracoccus sp.]